MANKNFWRKTIIWGFLLWLFGYILGFVFFAFIPNNLLGWAIMPFGIIFTIWVLLKKINFTEFKDYFLLGFIWALIAVICDYLFLVLLLHPADGYYKLDVYIYYSLTLLVPIIYWFFKRNKN